MVATKPDYQTKGVGVVRGYEYSWDEEIERDDPGWYIVDFPNQYKVKMGKGSLRLANSAVRSRAARNAEFKPGDVVSYRSANGMTWTGIVKSDMNGWCKPDEILVLRTGDTKPHVIPKRAVIPNSLRSTNAVVAKALNARAVCNASYSAALKAIMDAVKPYMDRRITDDTSWRYPALVISKLRDVCERAVMSAGRYDGKRPPHRVYDVECVKDGFKFSGNLIVSGLLHRDDPDDVSAFDEYDMILSLGYTGRA